MNNVPMLAVVVLMLGAWARPACGQVMLDPYRSVLVSGITFRTGPTTHVAEPGEERAAGLSQALIERGRDLSSVPVFFQLWNAQPDLPGSGIVGMTSHRALSALRDPNRHWRSVYWPYNATPPGGGLFFDMLHAPPLIIRLPSELLEPTPGTAEAATYDYCCTNRFDASFRKFAGAK